MEILHIIGGPLVGAVIGYFTNYIAVKMLFRPLRPVKIWKWTMPFTPGIIPKRKPALAKALGKAVGTTLLTTEDLKNTLLSENVKKSVSELVIEQIEKVSISEMTIKQVALTAVSEGNYIQIKGDLAEKATDKVMEHLVEANVGTLVVEEAKKAIVEKLSGSFMAMFLNDDLLESISEPIKEYIDHYIENEGRNYVEPAVEKELNAIEEVTLSSIAQGAKLNPEKMRAVVGQVYDTCIEKCAEKILVHFKVDEIVEGKINEMKVEDLEELVLSVMKHELTMIVNLGALIGFVLGIFNLLFY